MASLFFGSLFIATVLWAFCSLVYYSFYTGDVVNTNDIFIICWIIVFAYLVKHESERREV